MELFEGEVSAGFGVEVLVSSIECGALGVHGVIDGGGLDGGDARWR